MGGDSAEFGEGVVAVGGDQQQVRAERGPGVAPGDAGQQLVHLAFQGADGEVAGEVLGGRREGVGVAGDGLAEADPRGR